MATLIVTALIFSVTIHDPDEQQSVRLVLSGNSAVDTEVFVFAFIESAAQKTAETGTTSADDTQARTDSAEACLPGNNLTLSLMELPTPNISLIPLLTMPSDGPEMLQQVGALLVGAGGGPDLTYPRRKPATDFRDAYRDLAKRAAIAALNLIQDPAGLARATVTGAVSTYNPFRGGKLEGGPETASGEFYDATAWTAAIKTELRNRFGGVRYGKLYQPAFALVESGDKQLIVKINDVGPLRPGRVLDLNERSMRHFDPFLTKGVIRDVRVTLLPGEDWTPGPVGVAYAVDRSDRGWRTASVQSYGIASVTQSANSEPAPVLAPALYTPNAFSGRQLRAEVTADGGG